MSPAEQAAGPSARQSSRAVHPTNLRQEDLPGDDLLGALSFRALRAIATGFARVESPAGPHDSGSAAKSRLAFLYQPIPATGCFHRPFISFKAP